METEEGDAVGTSSSTVGLIFAISSSSEYGGTACRDVDYNIYKLIIMIVCR